MKKDCRGITLFELLLVIGIFLVIVATSLPIYSQLQAGSQLSTVSRDLVENIHTSQVRSFSRYNGSAHGFYIDTAAKSYTLFQGANYATRVTAYDHVYVLPQSMRLATNLTGQQVVFSPELGRPNNTGTITLTDARGQSRVLTIGSLGAVDIN